MIPAKNRAEKIVMDALLKDKDILAIYGKDNVFQGYAVPNTMAALDRFVLIHRIDSINQAQTCTGAGANMLRRVRLQIDVWDVRYSDAVRYGEMIADILNREFPSCIDGDSYGTDGRGQKVFNVFHLDVIIYEQAEKKSWPLENLPVNRR